MEGDTVALELRSLEAGVNKPSDRVSDIQEHFGDLVGKYKKTMDGSSFLEEQLSELDPRDFTQLVAKQKSRGGGGWLFGGGNDENQQLLFLVTELGRIRDENQRIALENERLVRENLESKFEWRKSCSKWTAGILMSLCAGSSILNGWLGNRLAEFADLAQTTEPLVNLTTAAVT